MFKEFFILFLFVGYSYAEGTSVIKGTMSLPFEASMKLGYFFNVNDIAGGAKSPFTRSARESYATIKHQRTNFLYKIVSSSQEKRDLLDISGSLSLKIKALGGIDISASGSYLKDKGKGNKFVEMLVVVKIEKETRTLTAESEKQSGYIDLVKKSASSGNYHYVRSVTFGGELIASLKFTSRDNKDIEDIQAKASVDVKSTAVDVSVSGTFKKLAKSLAKVSNFEATIYQTGGSAPEITDSIDSLNSRLAKFISDMNDDANYAPIRASLLPIQHLVPTDKVISGIQFILDRRLQAASSRFEYYFDDVQQAVSIARDVEDSLSFRNVEQENEFESINVELQDLSMLFTKTIREISLNEGSSSRQNLERFEAAIKRYNDGISGHLPGKYLRAMRNLRDKIKRINVEATKPGLLRSEINEYLRSLKGSITQDYKSHRKILECGRKQLRGSSSKQIQSDRTIDQVAPGSAMHLYVTEKTIPSNTPISFKFIDFPEDVSFNTGDSPLKDYYRSVVFGSKRGLARFLHKHNKIATTFLEDDTAENKVPLFKENSIVAPSNGIYLLSYQLTNTGSETEERKPDSLCDQDWQEFENKCYWKSTKNAPFDTASQNCQNKDAELVSIHSKKEDDFVFKNRGYSWIGMKRTSVKPNNFDKWLDGTAIDFENWGWKEPNNLKEKCGSYFQYQRWNDNSCWKSLPYTCKKDINKIIKSKGLVRVKVMKEGNVLSEQRSHSETPKEVAGKICDKPFTTAPISKPVLLKLNSGDRVHIEQTVTIETKEYSDNFLDGVLLKQN
uniref:Toxin candidate TRINITY_DN19977_c1_g2_i1.p1 n=1 Tax=Ceriantheomorphe brasiliensis TaxID=1048506 RepID=A0A7G7WYW2_9CNID|nr:toxin candidate TRINITY_DN19977_c1_g2_i1.p1 [Ceriantheomorphe brasiliensis]